MKKFLFISLAMLALVVSYNCKKMEVNNQDIKLNLPSTPYNYGKITTPMGIEEVLYENRSPVNNAKATIGRVLFYDKALSLNNSVSCATCHKQGNAFADVNAFSKGFEEKLTLRNSISINNLRDEVGIGYFWDAREKSIESMVFAPIANHIEMGFERVDLIAEKIGNLPYYKDLFKTCYGDAIITTGRMRECMGNFLFSIVSSNSKFDREVLSSFIHYTKQELNGMSVFMNSNCNTCHFISKQLQSSYGANTGLTFANNGLDLIDSDKGIDGKFKIPRLNNVSKTAPYMHDGRFKTLDEVIEHYSHNIKDNAALSPMLKTIGGGTRPRGFNFTVDQKADLIAFLKTLDDDVVTTDVKYSSPFK